MKRILIELPINAELHCHNSFSNFHVGNEDPPYDCNVSIRDQLVRSHDLGLDAIFVTNHNTLDGYDQLLEYKKDHAKFKNIGVFPAEEITIDTGAHILAYGIHDAIVPGLSLEEVIDEVKNKVVYHLLHIHLVYLMHYVIMPKNVTWLRFSIVIISM